MGTDIKVARRGFVISALGATAILSTLTGALTPVWPVVCMLGGFAFVIGLIVSALEVFD